jgi:hypothetical protein
LHISCEVEGAAKTILISVSKTVIKDRDRSSVADFVRGSVSVYLQDWLSGFKRLPCLSQSLRRKDLSMVTAKELNAAYGSGIGLRGDDSPG